MNRSAPAVREHVVLSILRCATSADGGATILDVDTNSGPLRLRLARPFLHTLIGAASTPQLPQDDDVVVREPVAREPSDVPPIVRFLTTIQGPLLPEPENK